MDVDMKKPIPETQPWSEKFWEGTKEGKLLIQFCRDCNSNIFYPRKFCPECWSSNLGWKEASGKGRIFTYSTAYSGVEAKFADELPYTVAYVDLDEGIRLPTRIIDCSPEFIRIGMEVEVVFHNRDGVFLPYFRPISKK